MQRAQGGHAASSLSQPLLSPLQHPASFPVAAEESEDDDLEEYTLEERQFSQEAARVPVRSTADLDRVQAAQSHGRVVYVIGRSTVSARPGSAWMRKLLLEGVYNLLVNNCRGWAVVQNIPRSRLIQVGMLSEI